ncbi:hypothetical protein DIPPA_62442, partial [Diplonema papillatum]
MGRGESLMRDDDVLWRVLSFLAQKEQIRGRLMCRRWKQVFEEKCSRIGRWLGHRLLWCCELPTHRKGSDALHLFVDPPGTVPRVAQSLEAADLTHFAVSDLALPTFARAESNAGPWRILQPSLNDHRRLQSTSCTTDPTATPNKRRLDDGLLELSTTGYHSQQKTSKRLCTELSGETHSEQGLQEGNESCKADTQLLEPCKAASRVLRLPVCSATPTFHLPQDTEWYSVS